MKPRRRAPSPSLLPLFAALSLALAGCGAVDGDGHGAADVDEGEDGSECPECPEEGEDEDEVDDDDQGDEVDDGDQGAEDVESEEEEEEEVEGDDGDGDGGECAAGHYRVGGACIDAAAVGAIVDEIANDELVRQNLVGLAVGVVIDRELAYVGGYGHADWEGNVKVTKDTMFRWASISKPLTAVAAMQLWEDGHLDLDADVRTYVPGWPAKSQGVITMRHLLSNQSGIGHYSHINWNRSAYDPTKPYDPQKTIDVFKDAPLGFAPGSSYRYTTFGFNLASAVIDSAARSAYGSQTGYPELVAQRIAAPLGMKNLRPDYSAFQTITPRAAGYRQGCSQAITREGTTDVSYKLGGGGWISSVEDLTRFAEGLLQADLLEQSTQQTMWSQKQDSGGTMRNYGFGFSTTATAPYSANGRVSHSGGQENTRTYLLLYPGQGLGVIVMTNSTYAQRLRIVHRVANAFGRNWSIGEHSMFNQLGCAESCQGKSPSYFSGVWSAGGTDTVIRRGYTHAGFLTEWQRLLALGWVAVDFETRVDAAGQRRWDGVFKKIGGPAAMWRGFDHDGFQAKWEEMRALGYQLVDLETYVQGGTRRWAGLFLPGSGDHTMRRDLTHSEFHAAWQELGAAGYRLVDIETYEAGGQRRWAGVWHEASSGDALLRNFATADFGTKRSELHGQGYRLVDIESYTGSQGQRLWAGVFHKGSYGQTLNRNYSYCGILDRHETWAAQGLELIDLEHHD